MPNFVVLETYILNMNATDIQPEFKLTCTCKKVWEKTKKYSTHHKFQIQLNKEITIKFHN